MLTFGIDWDDVISPLNDCAIELANEEYHFEPPLTLEDIDSWENTGRASVHFRISRMKISLWDFKNPWFRWTLRWMTDRIIY